MRTTQSRQGVTVQVIAGTRGVLLAMDVTAAARKGLLGFAIERMDPATGRSLWLHGRESFAASGGTIPPAAPPASQPAAPTSAKGAAPAGLTAAPIQEFQWGDWTAAPGHKYVYKVAPVYGRPGQLETGPAVELAVTTESEAGGPHQIYFNRGVAASQAFVAQFGEPTRKQLDTPGTPVRAWLSNGLNEGLLAFLARATDKSFALRGSLYEFTDAEVFAAIAAARKRGVDLRLVVDMKGTKQENEQALSAADSPLKATWNSFVIPRNTPEIPISHNKFFVLLKGGKPVAVWTGSTNLTEGGIFGQANVGHAVDLPAVAAIYAAYWDQIAKNPTKAVIAAVNQQLTPPLAADGKPGVQVLFSPHPTDAPLLRYVSWLTAAKSAVLLTAPFGLGKLFADAMATKRSYLRYVLMDSAGSNKTTLQYTTQIEQQPWNRVAIGAELGQGEIAGWHAEHLTGLNEHVPYLHTKFMLVDPLSAAPLVATGSANFSEASTTANDENMIVIRGDPRVADIYLVEFMRLFKHYAFRDWANAQSAAGGKGGKGSRPGASKPLVVDLTANDSWTDPHFVAGSPLAAQRTYFAGTAAKRSRAASTIAK